LEDNKNQEMLKAAKMELKRAYENCGLKKISQMSLIN
jgi:hypothetical protein